MGAFVQIILNIISHFKENNAIWHCQRDLPGCFEGILPSNLREFQVFVTV